MNKQLISDGQKKKILNLVKLTNRYLKWDIK